MLWTAARTSGLAVFGVAHVLLQQRVTTLGCDCEGAGGIRPCETECIELGCNMSRNWRRTGGAVAAIPDACRCRLDSVRHPDIGHDRENGIAGVLDIGVSSFDPVDP